MTKVTPRSLWLAHRLAANGVSKISGAALPETLDECSEGVQETHYGMAVFVAAAHGEDAKQVPVPQKVTAERASALLSEMSKMGRSVAGLADAFESLADAIVKHVS